MKYQCALVSPILRQTFIFAGIMVILGVILGIYVSSAWFLLALLPAVGLLLAGLMGVCFFAIIVSRLPWNKKHRKK